MRSTTGKRSVRRAARGRVRQDYEHENDRTHARTRDGETRPSDRARPDSHRSRAADRGDPFLHRWRTGDRAPPSRATCHQMKFQQMKFQRMSFAGDPVTPWGVREAADGAPDPGAKSSIVRGTHRARSTIRRTGDLCAPAGALNRSARVTARRAKPPRNGDLIARVSSAANCSARPCAAAAVAATRAPRNAWPTPPHVSDRQSGARSTARGADANARRGATISNWWAHRRSRTSGAGAASARATASCAGSVTGGLIPLFARHTAWRRPPTMSSRWVGAARTTIPTCGPRISAATVVEASRGSNGAAA
jgi:hypothetical protein